MNICITGALGHIGSKLIRNLSVKNVDKIYLVDNLLTQRYSSLFDLPEKNYHFKEIDILSNQMDEIVRDSNVVIHLAAITNAEASVKNADLVEKINKEGTDYISQLCIKYGSSFLFPSSTSVYGVSKNVVTEALDEDNLKPQSPYAESKRYSEKKLQLYSQNKKLSTVIFRLGTIFGYSIGMRFHTAVNKFIWQALNGQEITVWKTALDQKRPYCALDDAISAINYVIENGIFDGEIYNIVTINETVKGILDVIGKFIPNTKIKFVESPIMNQLSYNVSNEKSIEKGFAYNGDLEKNVKECIFRLKNINRNINKTI